MISDNLPDISFINNLEVNDVVQRMLDDYKRKYKELTGGDVELAPANPYRLILYGCSLQIYQVMQYIDYAGKQNFLKYARGKYLDNLAALRGVKRKESTPAKTILRFSLDEPNPSTVIIPEKCMVTNGDGIYFVTDEYAEIPLGQLSVDVEATCTVLGSAGNNIPLDSVTTIVDVLPYVVKVTNIVRTYNGVDKERDDELRERVYNAADSYATTGTVAAYIYHVKNLSDDIEDVVVTSTVPGHVDVRFVMTGGAIPDAEMIETVQEHLDRDDIRPLTDTVHVTGPDIETYNVDLTYYIASSDATQAGNIQKAVETAVAVYNTWQTAKIGRDINPSYLIHKIVEAGAKRVEVTAPTRQVLSAITLAKTGTVNISYGGLEDD